jgi:WD40 repeat protein
MDLELLSRELSQSIYPQRLWPHQALIAPFGQQDIPESVTTTLEDYATCARFSPSGRLIAAGRADGWGTIWDLDTQGVLRSLEGHTKAITSVRSDFETSLLDIGSSMASYTS